MSKLWQTLSLAGITCLVLVTAAPVHAQSSDDKKLGEYDEIIIKRKSAQDGKVNLEVRDGKVLVDGQTLDNYNSNDFSIRQRPVHPVDGNRMNGMAMPRGGIQFFQQPAPPVANQALLGVITEKLQAKGVTIRQVGQDSPAEKAGLKTGDVLTKIDDHNIDEPQTLFETIGSYKPGDEVSITYLRNNKENKASAILGKHQAELGNLFNMEPGGDDQPFAFNFPQGPRDFPQRDWFSENNDHPRLGLSVQDTEDGKGARVLDVMGGTAAAAAGFTADDIIVRLGDKAVNGAKDVADVYQANKSQGTLTATVIRNGETKTLTIKVPKHLNKVDL